MCMEHMRHARGRKNTREHVPYKTLKYTKRGEKVKTETTEKIQSQINEGSSITREPKSIETKRMAGRHLKSETGKCPAIKLQITTSNPRAGARNVVKCPHFMTMLK